MKNFSFPRQGLLLALAIFCAGMLAAQTPAYYKGTGTSTNLIPLNGANNATHTQQIYTPSDFNTLPPSGLITKVYMRNSVAGASGTFTDFSISFLQNSLTAFPDNSFLTGFTTALSAPSYTISGNATAGGWFEIPLDVPFPYDNTQTLVFEIKYTGRTGGLTTYYTPSTGNKRLSIVAVPGPATGNLATTWADFGFDLVFGDCSGTPVPGASVVTPSVACANNPVQLGLNGHLPEGNLTYTWQASPDIAGPYTDISAPATQPGLAITASTTLYYRAAVSCNGGTPAYSDPVLLTVNPALPGNTYTIDNTQPTGGLNFNSFTDAFQAISCGVAGKTVFLVSVDQIFYENPPELLASGTATDSIIFRKSGSGANPVIIPLQPGTINSSTTLGAHGDAVITINGGDYITFDAIDINTSSFSSGPDLYEYGYYLKKRSATDASKHVTIKNSVITLGRGIHSFGIHVSNNSGTGSVTVTSTGGASEYIRLSGNTISNSYGGILARGQGTAAYYDQHIEIGVDSGNVVTDFGGGATTGYGIYVIGQQHARIANNTLSSVASGHTTTLYGIYSGAATNASLDIYNNTVTITGSGTTSSIYAIYNAAGGTGVDNAVKIYGNTVTGSSYATATTGDLYLIEQTASAYQVEISGNTLSNNTLSGTSAIFYMIHQDGDVVNQVAIFNNTISGNSKPAGTTGSTYCIYNTSTATANNLIYNNLIENITVNNTSGNLTGLHVLTGASNKVYNNRIYSLVNTASTTGAVYGITLGSGGLVNDVYNNMIADLQAPSSTTTGTSTTDLIRGINITSTTANSTQNLSYNTILLNATGGGIFSTSGVYHSTSATATTSQLNMRNNLVVNLSVASGIGYASAFRRSSATLQNYGALSDNNLFYVNAGPNQVIYYDGTNSDPDLAAFKARVMPREAASISENPHFVNGSSAPYDLHIDASLPTQVESGGTPVAGIGVDIDGEPRNAATPDMGADEFNGTTADLTGPTITYTPLAVKSICVDAKTITATIEDPSGVNVAPGTRPRLWFKKATENDVLPATNTSASDGWKYVEASNAASPFTFSFDFSLLTSPLVPGDSVSYFIVAQDLVATPNVGVNIAGFTATPPTVALGDNAFPLSGNIRGFSILSLPALTVKASNTQVCGSGSVQLDVDNVDVTGGGYQWQSSAHGANAWTDIDGATTLPYTTAVLTDTTDFRLVVSCGVVPVDASPSNVLVIHVNNPAITTATGGSNCGTGTVNLVASATSGLDIQWYESATATTPLASGPSFTTPVLTTTTTYYAAASAPGGGLTSLGLPTPSPTAVSGAGTTNYGIVFDALSDFTLQAVTIYPVAATAGTAGTVTIDVINDAGTVVHSATVNVVGYPAATPVPQTVTLNFTIAAGTNYKLRPGARTGISGLLFNSSTGSSNWGYPFVLPGLVSITSSTWAVHPGNTPMPELYYYFYNWQIVSACVGARVPVVATINSDPGCVMPVTLLHFKGEKQAGYNRLSWSTATETHNSGFALERSADGARFQQVSFVGSQAPDGNSTARLDYRYDDASPLAGYNYYRLKQVDRDGRSAYSNTVVIRNGEPGGVQLVSVYPNPARSAVQLKYTAPAAQDATVIITDAVGQVVVRKPVRLLAGENNLPVATAGLAQGSYFVSITCADGCRSAVQKFVKE